MILIRFVWIYLNWSFFKIKATIYEVFIMCVANKFNNVRVASVSAIIGICTNATKGGMGNHLPASSAITRES